MRAAVCHGLHSPRTLFWASAFPKYMSKLKFKTLPAASPPLWIMPITLLCKIFLVLANSWQVDPCNFPSAETALWGEKWLRAAHAAKPGGAETGGTLCWGPHNNCFFSSWHSLTSLKKIWLARQLCWPLSLLWFVIFFFFNKQNRNSQPKSSPKLPYFWVC